MTSLSLTKARLCGVWTEKDLSKGSGDYRLMAPTVMRGAYEGAAAIAIAEALKPELHHLQIVDVRGNFIRGEAATRLATAVLALPTLTTFNSIPVGKMREDKQGGVLDVRAASSDIGIGVEGAVTLASLLGSTPSLTELNLGNQALCVHGSEYTGLAALAQAISTSTTLAEIDLQSNSIRDEGAKILAEAIKANRSLTKINLTDNGIGEEGLKMLADAGREGLALEMDQQNRQAEEYAKHVNDTMAAMLR